MAQQQFNIQRLGAVFALILGLCACGGGGGSGAAPRLQPSPTVVEPTTPPDTTAYIMDQFFPGKNFAGLRSLARAANPGNPITNTLINCTVLVTEDNLCSFNQIPLLGMETSAPTVDQVMDRVLVSHDWMAVRMREVFNEMPPELLLIMRGITAIVISYDVRPSFYWSGSGAIYIDPDRLWLTTAEQQTIDPAPDYRADLGNVFLFTMPARYVANGDTDLRSLNRDLSSISMRLAGLFYHELAHANDYYPPGRLASIDRTVPMYLATSANGLPSNLLQGTFPLTSVLMDRLAGVSFRSETVRLADQSLTAEDIAAEFPLDVANDFYSYSSSREDLAMLFEEVMMYYSYGLDRDVAVTDLPANLESCSQLRVAWGQRNRVAQTNILPRATLILEALLPELAAAVTLQLDDVVPTQMRVDEDFCTNILVSPSATRSLVLPGAVNTQLPPLFQTYL
ncbi:hypothetical protein OAD22_07120 [Pseudomonadales bacterium]|nr:hypothetical protein [Pseudomonadales bacterium]MDA9366102.1 hypothetical protein [Pseudomonadales bacterium]MDB9917518.1 hypothetical protein [Pseudomonadales bacterium]